MNHKAIGFRIKTARERAHLTQEELAGKTNLSTTHISCIERGVKPPKLDTFVAIANSLNTSPDILLQDVLVGTSNPFPSELIFLLHKFSKSDQERIIRIIQILEEVI